MHQQFEGVLENAKVFCFSISEMQSKGDNYAVISPKIRFDGEFVLLEHFAKIPVRNYVRERKKFRWRTTTSTIL